MKLVLSFAPPKTWRSKNNLRDPRWQRLRITILERDKYTCQYCGYISDKFQIVHHIDGNAKNNDKSNLVTICQMCNLIEHSGQGCELKGIVDLYKQSRYKQVDIIRMTRKMRDNGKKDLEIIRFLGLKERVFFKMDREYLKRLFGFITSRPSKQEDDMYDKWLEYHKSHMPIVESRQKSL